MVVASTVVVPLTAQLAAATAPSGSRSMWAGCTSRAATTTSEARLGAGVSLGTGRAGNLFPAGSSTRLRVTGPSSGPAAQRLRLQVRDETRAVTLRQAALPRTSEPSTPSDATATRRTVAVPDRAGWYQVRAERVGDGRVLGVTCLWYGVAMRGAKLDLGSLPPGKDWGGPGPLRDVALNAQLGLGVVRYQLDVASFLADPGYADPELTTAARQAQQLGLRFVVQIGQGAAAETSAVRAGTWGHLVRRIARTYPAVRYWSPWNEPNDGQFFFGSEQAYVDRVLRPADRAVHAAGRHAQVVGGGAIGDDATWWNRFAALGGFRDLDAIAVNPYTSRLGAPESAGLVAALQLVRRLARTHGAGRKPILDTESAFPSSYPDVRADLVTQSDYVSRKFVLERALGVGPGEYLLEGGWQNWDVIDYFRGVKPAAMALSAAATLLAHRHFVGWVRTGVAGAWAARFSGTSGSPRQLLVAWSSAGSHRLRLAGAHTGFDAFGAPERFRGSLLATGALSFLSVPAGSRCLS